jgi:hypothetical protein
MFQRFNKFNAFKRLEVFSVLTFFFIHILFLALNKKLRVFVSSSLSVKKNSRRELFQRFNKFNAFKKLEVFSVLTFFFIQILFLALKKLRAFESSCLCVKIILVENCFRGSMRSKGWKHFPLLATFLLKKLRVFASSCLRVSTSSRIYVKQKSRSKLKRLNFINEIFILIILLNLHKNIWINRSMKI